MSRVPVDILVSRGARSPAEGQFRPRFGPYTRSPLQDSRLFGPSPWKILATTYYKKQRCLSNPAPGENLESGNLVMETGCTPFNLTPLCTVSFHTLNLQTNTLRVSTSRATAFCFFKAPFEHSTLPRAYARSPC